MGKAVKWDIVFCLRAAQAELPEQASTTCTAFALPRSNANTKLRKHPAITSIDTIPAGHHVYAEAEACTWGRHQSRTNKPTSSIICAVAITAGQQHILNTAHQSRWPGMKPKTPHMEIWVDPPQWETSPTQQPSTTPPDSSSPKATPLLKHMGKTPEHQYNIGNPQQMRERKHMTVVE
jgi:hypothetical protein